MQITNSDDRYGLIAKFFHWTIALLILGLIPVGLGMGIMPNSPLKFEVYALHKSFGLLVFFLGLARLLWRFITPAPDHLESHKPWELALAKASHIWLYVCVIGMPLSGWLMSSAGQFPVPFFGYQMPYLIDKSESLGELFYQVHSILAYTLMFILALHVAGALKHHLIDRDETLQRMTWRRAGIFTVIVLVLEVGTVYAVSGLAIWKQWTMPGEQAVENDTKENSPATAQVDPASLAKDGWAIVPDKSKVQFSAVLYNADFTTDLNDVTGDIVFNPDDLANADVRVRIGTRNITSGDAERDSNMTGAEWLDSENYPDIWFVADEFEKGEGNNYMAIGRLTVKGKTMPLILPFTLNIRDKTAHMTAKVTINRMDFGVGAESWPDESTVGHAVTIMVDLTAVQ